MPDMSLITVMSADDLGIHACSDRIYDALADREGDRRTGSCVLATDEVWDYDDVAEEWLFHVRDRLAAHGIRYDPERDEALVPVSLASDEARRICAEVVSGFTEWIEHVVSEVREGKPDPRRWDTRSEDDAGARWTKWAPG
jgi:hypothetical protein